MCLLQTKTFPVCRNVLKFQNEYNKVEIEFRVAQFSTEIKLVITNRTPASRSCAFCNHAFYFSPNCTPLSSITIINEAAQMNGAFRNVIVGSQK